MREPQIHRPLEGKLRLKIDVPFGEGKTVRPWLKEVCGAGTQHEFDKSSKEWLVARAYLGRLRDALVDKYGACSVLIDSRFSQRTRCDIRCTGARKDDCVCECGGVNHRGTQSGYVQVGETTFVRQEGSVGTTLRRYERRRPAGPA